MRPIDSEHRKNVAFGTQNVLAQIIHLTGSLPRLQTHNVSYVYTLRVIPGILFFLDDVMS